MGLGTGTTKTVTVGEVAAAMQANGLKKSKGWNNKNDKGEIVAACAIMQAAIRLEVEYTDLSSLLSQIEVFNGEWGTVKLNNFIIHLNDSTPESVSKIGSEVGRRIATIHLMPLTVKRSTYKVATMAEGKS